MVPILVAGLLLATSGSAQEAGVELRRGDHVVVAGMDGRIEVGSWDRSTLEVTGRGGGDPDVTIRRDGGRVVVGPGERKGRERPAAWEIRLPPWVALEVQGRVLDVSVTGMTGGVEVFTVEGDIHASGVSGSVSLSTVEGKVEVRDARGRIAVRSRADDVTLFGVEGTVEASTLSGDLSLQGVRASSVRAETMDGDLLFQGALTAGGTYRFAVHSGDADLVVPPDTGARVRVSTFEGEFTSDFRVTLRGFSGKGVFDVTLGDGSASLDVQVFDGGIRLRSAGR